MSGHVLCLAGAIISLFHPQPLSLSLSLFLFRGFHRPLLRPLCKCALKELSSRPHWKFRRSIPVANGVLNFLPGSLDANEISSWNIVMWKRWEKGGGANKIWWISVNDSHCFFFFLFLSFFFFFSFDSIAAAIYRYNILMDRVTDLQRTVIDRIYARIVALRCISYRVSYFEKSTRQYDFVLSKSQFLCWINCNWLNESCWWNFTGRKLRVLERNKIISFDE